MLEIMGVTQFDIIITSRAALPLALLPIPAHECPATIF